MSSSRHGGSPDAPLGVRRVAQADADRVTELFALAFQDDPTWSWAFPDPDQRLDQLRSLWALLLHSALPHDWVWMTDDGGAASLWIPPGESELSDTDEAHLELLVRNLVGSRANEVMALFERFDANHPRQEPHFYLSLLGTHPDHRGQGKGMRLLAANLADDRCTAPAGLPRVQQPRERSPL